MINILESVTLQELEELSNVFNTADDELIIDIITGCEVCTEI